MCGSHVRGHWILNRYRWNHWCYIHEAGAALTQDLLCSFQIWPVLILVIVQASAKNVEMLKACTCTLSVSPALARLPVPRKERSWKVTSGVCNALRYHLRVRHHRPWSSGIKVTQLKLISKCRLYDVIQYLCQPFIGRLQSPIPYSPQLPYSKWTHISSEVLPIALCSSIMFGFTDDKNPRSDDST